MVIVIVVDVLKSKLKCIWLVELDWIQLKHFHWMTSLINMQEVAGVTVQMSPMVFVLFLEHLLKIMTCNFFGTYFSCLHWDAAKNSWKEVKLMLLRVGNGTPCDIRTRKYAKNCDQTLFEGLNTSFILAKIGNGTSSDSEVGYANSVNMGFTALLLLTARCSSIFTCTRNSSITGYKCIKQHKKLYIVAVQTFADYKTHFEN